MATGPAASGHSRPPQREAQPRGWAPLTSPQRRDGLHVEVLCGHCGVLLMLDGVRYDEHLWVGAEVLCHLCGSVNPVPQTSLPERN